MEIGRSCNMNMNMNMWKLMSEELTRGRDSAKLLQNHLDPSAPREAREYLIHKILTAYTNALQIVNSQPYDSEFQTDQINLQGKVDHSPSHCSVDSSDHLENHGRPSKKRKTLPRWVKKVKVETETDGGLQGPPNDGYNWRKYGQKEIHGAAFPRGYYRCTHLHSQGCIAAKQIQKSDDDPTVFHVTYRGHHTCTQSTPSTLNPPPDLPLAKPKPKPEPKPAPAPAPDLPPEEDFFSFSRASPEAASTVEVFIAPSPATVTATATSFTGNNAGWSGGVWTPESDMNDQGASAPNSPVLDWPLYTLAELGIDAHFSFHNPQTFFF